MMIANSSQTTIHNMRGNKICVGWHLYVFQLIIVRLNLSGVRNCGNEMRINDTNRDCVCGCLVLDDSHIAYGIHIDYFAMLHIKTFIHSNNK